MLFAEKWYLVGDIILPHIYIRSFFMSDKRYDLAVIGGGPGGYNAAALAANSGMKTVLLRRTA